MLLCLVLSACGFTPLYAPQNNSTGIVSSLAAVTVQTGGGEESRKLRIALEDLLRSNSLVAPQYALSVSSTLFRSDVAIQQDTEVTRRNLTLRSTFTLRDLATNEPLYEAKSFGIVAYNRVASEFANIIAERDAEDRVTNQVAEEIHTKLAIYFERQES